MTMRSSDRITPVGPIGRVTEVEPQHDYGGGQFATAWRPNGAHASLFDVVLLSTTRAVIVVAEAGPTFSRQAAIHLVVVDPSTASPVSILDITLPVAPALIIGGFFRYSDQAVGFVAEGDNYQFGTIDLNGTVRVGTHVREHDEHHSKDTAQSLYYDLDNSTVSAMYWSVYDFVGSNFNTVAWAVTMNLATLTASEYQVFVNMGSASDTSPYPQYYGTLMLPGNRAVGASYLDEAGDRNGYRLRDNNGTLIDEVRVPLPNGFDGMYLYQLGTSQVIGVVYFQYEDNYTTSYIMLQRYQVTPTAVTKLGGPVNLGANTYPQYLLPFPQSLMALWFSDEVNTLSFNYRIGAVIYDDNRSMNAWNGINVYPNPDNSGIPVVGVNHATGGFTSVATMQHNDMDIQAGGAEMYVNWLPAATASDYVICTFMDKLTCWYQLFRLDPGELNILGTDRPPIIFW